MTVAYGFKNYYDRSHIRTPNERTFLCQSLFISRFSTRISGRSVQTTVLRIRELNVIGLRTESARLSREVRCRSHVSTQPNEIHLQRLQRTVSRIFLKLFIIMFFSRYYY